MVVPAHAGVVLRWPPASCGGGGVVTAPAGPQTRMAPACPATPRTAAGRLCETPAAVLTAASPFPWDATVVTQHLTTGHDTVGPPKPPPPAARGGRTARPDGCAEPAHRVERTDGVPDVQTSVCAGESLARPSGSSGGRRLSRSPPCCAAPPRSASGVCSTATCGAGPGPRAAGRARRGPAASRPGYTTTWPSYRHSGRSRVADGVTTVTVGETRAPTVTVGRRTGRVALPLVRARCGSATGRCAARGVPREAGHPSRSAGRSARRGTCRR